MKRIIVCLLASALLFCLVGCQKKQNAPESPVSFYYLAVDRSYDSTDSLMYPETRESSGHENDLKYLLDTYLAGPVTEGFVTPFPSNVQLVSVTFENAIARIVLTDEIASLSGMNLTVACACLTMTVLELSDAKTVEISAETSMLNGSHKITMDRSSLLFLDDPTIHAADHTAN